MREIKFRAWDKNENCWINGFAIHQSGLFSDMCKNNKQYWYDDNQMKNIVIQQYTGLKDKNGKEIYEGDIVKYKSFGKELISNVIQDLRLGTGHYIKGEHVGFYSINESTVKNFEIEVIGNIYENPELLEGEK